MAKSGSPEIISEEVSLEDQLSLSDGYLWSSRHFTWVISGVVTENNRDHMSEWVSRSTLYIGILLHWEYLSARGG